MTEPLCERGVREEDKAASAAFEEKLLWLDTHRADASYLSSEALGLLDQAFADHASSVANAERDRIAAWLREQHNGKLVSSVFLANAIEANQHRED